MIGEWCTARRSMSHLHPSFLQPHSPSLLASASYDMTARIWDVDHPSASLSSVASRLGQPQGMGGALKKVHDAHTEFVVGLAWGLFQEGLVASTAWDMSVHLWPSR
jgi:peroxin-7